MLVNGFLLILGHFAYPFVYDGGPFADVLATATTATAATVATRGDDREDPKTHGSMMHDRSRPRF